MRFEDGVAGELDFAGRLRFEGVFAELRDPAVFARVRNGADLDSDVLYAGLSGIPLDVRRTPSGEVR